MLNEDFLDKLLSKRAATNALRELKSLPKGVVDFSSNDYLGFAKLELPEYKSGSGSTGSRLLTGNYSLIEAFEQKAADFHKADAGLMFNSGYLANLGILSSVPTRHDTIIIDELCHASIYDGVRLSHANVLKFKHNNLADLEQKYRNAKGEVFVVVESLYSMDGDLAPLQKIAEFCEVNNAKLIVDEAHSVGIFGEKGEGIVAELGLQNKVFCRIITFGKALGSHGAMVLGSEKLRSFLINFCRPFIYTTAPSPNNIWELSQKYDILSVNEFNLLKINDKINLFKSLLKNDLAQKLTSTASQITGLLVGGNKRTKQLSASLLMENFDVRPILSPTVKEGEERLRICFHSYNTNDEIEQLAKCINNHYPYE